MTHPDWVLKHKRKGTLIMRRDDRYYLYRVSSHWNKEKKRAQLKTEEYLGRITPDGLIEPKAKRIMKRCDQVSVKEYGSSFLLNHVSGDFILDRTGPLSKTSEKREKTTLHYTECSKK